MKAVQSIWIHAVAQNICELTACFADVFKMPDAFCTFLQYFVLVSAIIGLLYTYVLLLD